MKPLTHILTLVVLLGALLLVYLYRSEKPPALSPQQLTLEQILSIKELHLVRHTYTDVFYLHKQNKKERAIRAIIQVPVEVTAYINLRDIQVVMRGDSIQKLVVPKAVLHKPFYDIDHMVVRETRSFQFHIGKDLYPAVSQYMQAAITERLKTVTTSAMHRNITLQAETEAKEYIEMCLRSMGRSDIVVSFNDVHKNKEVTYHAMQQYAVFYGRQ